MICFQMSSIVAKNCKMSLKKKTFSKLGNVCLFYLQYFLESNTNLLWSTSIWLVTSIFYFASFSQFIHFSAFPSWLYQHVLGDVFFSSLYGDKTIPLKKLSEVQRKPYYPNWNVFFYNCETRVGICNLFSNVFKWDQVI